MDILELIDQLQGGGTDAQSLIEVLADLLRADGKSQFIRDSEHAIQTRVLSNGLAVTLDANGVGRDVIGTTQFDTFNFLANVTVNATNPRQADISVSGGADCMFNCLVSSCWAVLVAAGRGVEGQVVTTVSGCTFKLYSTVGGAVTQAAVDFPSTTPAVIAVCPGTYAESNIQFATSQYVRILGSGADATIIGGVSAASPNPTFDCNTNAFVHLWVTACTIKTSHGTGSTAGAGIKVKTPTVLHLVDCTLTGNTTASGGNPEYSVLDNTGGTIAFVPDILLMNCNVNGTYGVNFDSDNQAVRFTDNYIDATVLVGGIFREDCLIANNHVVGAIGFELANSTGTGNCDITTNKFINCTTPIKTLGTTADGMSITNNTTDSCAGFLDVSSLSGGSSSAATGRWVIQDNKGNLDSGSAVIVFPATALQRSWAIENNHFWAETGTISLFSGAKPYPGTKFTNNTVDTSSTTSNDPQAEPIDGGNTRNYTTGIYFVDDDSPFVLGVTACTIRFGDTITQVTRQTAALTNATGDNYYEINSAGTFSCNGTAFTAGSFPVLKVTTASSIYSSHTDVAGIGYVQSATGGGTAPASGKFITYASDATLTANRVLAPISGYTPVGGVGFIDAGTDDGAITGTLKDLTANWTQAGVFDISTAGNLTVLKHGAFGANSSISTTQIANFTETMNNATVNGNSVVGILTALTANPTSNNAGEIRGLQFQGTLLAGAAGLSQTGTVYGIDSLVTVTRLSSNSITASDVRGIFSRATVNTGNTATALYAFYASDATGSGTVTTQYGFYVPAFAKGATNWAFYNAGTAASAFGGSVQIGGTSTPASTADIRGAVTLDGIAAPATPASDDMVIYNETGTDFLKLKEDNGAVYNLTHKHLWDAAVDVTTASTTVPPMLVGPMPNDGTITNVYAKLTDNKTNGATSSIFDIHKVLLANANTDGQGTTIYTTQGNRPTISNGNMYTAATAPDVTTFAAGDWFAIYVDQTGTTATFAVVGMHVRYT